MLGPKQFRYWDWYGYGYLHHWPLWFSCAKFGIDLASFIWSVQTSGSLVLTSDLYGAVEELVLNKRTVFREFNEARIVRTLWLDS